MKVEAASGRSAAGSSTTTDVLERLIIEAQRPQLQRLEERLDEIREQLAQLVSERAANASATPKALTVQDVAERTGKSRETVRSWIQKGLLKAGHDGDGRDWVIEPEDFEEFRRNRKRRGPSAASDEVQDEDRMSKALERAKRKAESRGR